MSRLRHGPELLALCVLAFTVCPAAAQVGAAEITGVVRDSAGAAVPGAAINVVNVATNEGRVVESSREGVYAAAGLAPGHSVLDPLKGLKLVAKQTANW